MASMVSPPIPGKGTPLLYSGIGRYKCTITAKEKAICEEFVVYEEKGTLCVRHVEPKAVKFEECSRGQEYLDVLSSLQDRIHLSEPDLKEPKTKTTDPKALSKLHILEEIGQGAFGQVFKAVWRGSIVAAKEVRVAGNKKIVENEIYSYKSLNHPNILSLLGTVEKPFSIMLITNYVNGTSLHSLIFDKDDQITFKQKLIVSRQVCQAIVFMHSASPPIAHLDLKPENVMVEEGTLRVYLAHFGLGKAITGSRVFGLSTMQSGTPGFQAPEQLRGERLGIHCDIYALGAVLTEVFGAKPIWDNSLSGFTIIYNVTTLGQVPSHDHLPLRIQEVVKACFLPVDQRASAATVLGMLCDMS